MATLTRHKAVGKGRKKKGKSSTKSLEENWLSEYNNLRVAGRAKQDSTLFFFFSFLCVHVSLSQGRALHTARSFFLSFFSVFPPGDKQTPPSAIRRRRERELFHILFCMCQRCCPHTLYLLRNVARGQLL